MRAPDTMLIAITLPDDTTAIMHFVTAEYAQDGTVRWMRLATEQAVEREFQRSGIPTWTRWRFITASDIPADRSYRNAWRDRGTHIDHDLEHAKAIHRAHLRARRAPELAELDVKQMRALAAKDDAAVRAIEARKQALRDITAHPEIEAATTVEALNTAARAVLA